MKHRPARIHVFFRMASSNAVVVKHESWAQESLFQSPVINKAALDKLQEEILSQMDVHRQEMSKVQERMFEKFQSELLGAFSRNVTNERTSQQQQQEISTTFPQCLDTTSANSVHPVFQPDPKHGSPSPVGLQDTRRPSKDSSSQTDKPIDKPKFSKSKTFRGSFEAHPELYAFLQAKNWDSEFTHQPCSEDADEADNTAKSSMWSRVKLIVMSSAFDLGVGSAIMANSLVMALGLEYESGIIADKMNGTEGKSFNHHSETAFEVLEHIFAVIFLLELLLRIAVMGCTYFKQALNLMDVLIVLVSILELYVFPHVGADAPNMSFFRLLRVFKMVRALRIVRVLKFFENLRVLVAAVISAVRSFIWSMLLLGMVQLIASIFMTQSLQSYFEDQSADVSVKQEVFEYFGSWVRSYITLFEMTLAIGTWGRYGRLIIFEVNSGYAVFFLGYLALVSFAMIRVIAALFLKDTLASAAKDSDVVTAEMNRDPRYIKQIRKVFAEMDVTGDGVLTLEEIHEVLADTKAIAILEEFGVVPRELKGLFELMDDGDDKISFNEFLAGIMRLKSSNKGVDLATLLYENKKILSRVVVVKGQIEELGNNLELQIEQLGNQFRDRLSSNLPVNGCTEELDHREVASHLSL